MGTLAWILVAAPACLLLLLAIPVEFHFAIAHRDGTRMGRAHLVWLFGMARIPMRGTGKRKKPRRRKTKDRPGGARRFLGGMGVEGFAGRVLDLLLDLLGQVHVDELFLHMRLGLDDPADTGRLWGVVAPLALILESVPVARISVRPDFTAEALELDGRGRIRILPLGLLWRIAVFLASPVTMRAFHAMGVRS